MYIITNANGQIVDTARSHNEALNVVTAQYRRHHEEGPFTTRPAREDELVSA